ncbi:MAG: CRISPR-associated endonuclease Cas1 [Candidatus Aenigmarchaeota archaeon]|nr:CRISPR-associated endonuclease Cas1 [Candidatus Aenigmarchaeota archaeon]
MQIVVNEYDTVIRKEENRFILTTGKKKEEFSADNVSQIIIATGASLSARVVKLAMENDVDILYINMAGKPYARIYPCKLGGTTLTRRRQATQHASLKVTEAVKNIIRSKIYNQIALLKSLEKTRESVDFSVEIKDISEQVLKICSLEGGIEELRKNLLGIEGFCSSKYFGCLSRILPFTERQHEAKDPFNAMLNYGYGILYSEVERACIIAGLDPYLGFMHTDRYNKPSLVLDMIEQFRQPVVDRAVINLFSRKQIEDSDFEQSGKVFMLSKKGREKLIAEVLSIINRKVSYKGRELSWKSIILERCRELVRLLLNETDEYPVLSVN